MEIIKIIALIVFWAVLLWAALYDWKHRIIPDTASVLTAVSGFLILQSPIDSLIGSLAGGGLLFVMAMINPNWVGGGDIKLLAGIGTAFGWSVLWVLWIACLIGLIFLWISRKKSLPFAPFLFGGTIIVSLVTLGGMVI